MFCILKLRETILQYARLRRKLISTRSVTKIHLTITQSVSQTHKKIILHILKRKDAEFRLLLS